MNVIEIFAKFIVDTSDLDKGLNEAEKKADSAGSKVGGVLSGIGKGLLGLGTAGVAAVSATATATGALAKQATDAYREFEQLEGGVKTLFGDTTAISNYRAELEAMGLAEDEIQQKLADYTDPISAKVMENAAVAYQTAGMSANEYMNTVIGMAGALNKATGDTELSAKLADQAIIDMSDNVNKMGTTMESVQNAYRGFSRGNFTMLDNLSLGFAGTKEGMQELLDSAKAISGVEYDIDSYADIVNAIHVVQENMGITGTTAKEAGDTISGSAGAMKAAWDNLVLGIANPKADLGVLISAVVESAKVAINNVIPVFSQALEGVGKLVKEIAPVISQELPALIDAILPQILDAAMSLMEGLTAALPDIVQILVDQTPLFVQAVELIMNSIVAVLPDLLMAITNAIPALLGAVADILETNAPILVQAAVDMIVQLTNAFSEMLPTLVDQFVNIISQIALVLTKPENIRAMTSAAVKLVTTLAKSLWDNRKKVLDVMRQIAKALTEALSQELPQFRAVFETIGKIIDGVFGFIEKHGTEIESVLAGILAGFIAFKTVTGVIEGVQGAIKGVNTVITVMNGLMEAAALINPYTAIAAAIGLAVGAMVTLTAQEMAEQEAYRKALETISEENQKRLDFANEYIGKMDEIYDKNRDVVQSVEDEMKPQQELREELDKIVDANGHIKQGYEERAKVITDQLNEAFDTELQLQGNVITNYDTEMAKIDQLIEKKKAEALISANTEAYSQALKDQLGLFDSMNAVQDQYNGLMSERDRAMKSYEWNLRKAEEAENKLAGSGVAFYQAAAEADGRVHDLNIQMGALEETLYSTQYSFYKNQDFIKDYDALLEACEGNTEDLSEAVDRMTNGIIEEGTDEIMKTQADNAIYHMSELIRQHDKNLKVSEDTLRMVVSEGQAAIAAMEQSGYEGADVYRKQFERLVEEASGWGVDLVSEFTSGIEMQSSSLNRAVDGVANAVRSRLHFSQPDVGPLSDFSSYAPDMMDLFAKGILDNEYKVSRAVESAFDFKDAITTREKVQNATVGAAGGLITPTASKQPITLILEINQQQFGKIVFDANLAESQRIGVDLGRKEVAYS